MLEKTKPPYPKLTMLKFSCRKGCMKLSNLGNIVVLLIQFCHCKTANFLNLNTLLQHNNALGVVYLNDSLMPQESIYWRKILHLPQLWENFNSNSREQILAWSFISLEFDVEKQLSCVTKIEPEPMMKVSLVLSVRQLHNGRNHLFSDSKISGFKSLEREELIFGDNGIVSMSNFSSLAEKQKH